MAHWVPIREPIDERGTVPFYSRPSCGRCPLAKSGQSPTALKRSLLDGNRPTRRNLTRHVFGGPACRAAIERQLSDGGNDLRVIGFHRQVKVGTLPLERVRTFVDPAELFFNVNRPEDLARAEDVWRHRG